MKKAIDFVKTYEEIHIKTRSGPKLTGLMFYNVQ